MKDLIAANKTILLVDDNMEILELIKEQIKSNFEEVLLAKNGIDACKILEKCHVNLIVTDYLMPKMNGLQLISYVKATYPLIPILLLTGNGNTAVIISAFQNGAVDVVEKPYQIEILINRIQNGLLTSELSKILWSLMSQELSLPRLEEYLKKPVDEQHRLIYAYNSVLRMKLINKDKKGVA